MADQRIKLAFDYNKRSSMRISVIDMDKDSRSTNLRLQPRRYGQQLFRGTLHLRC